MKRKIGFFILMFFFAAFMFTDFFLHPISIEPIRNSIRLLVSTAIIVFFGRYIIRLKPLFLLFAVLNSILIIFQAFDHYNSSLLPEYLKAENIVHFDDYRRSFRNPGVLFGFQIASFVTIYAIEIASTYRFKWRNVVISVMLVSLLFGSRIVLLSYMFYNLVIRPKNSIKFALILLFITVILLSMITVPDAVMDYFKLRFGFIYDLSNGVFSDYSAKDTISFYDNINKLSLIDWIIGNGYPQYSSKGGDDPLYLRYLFQTGFLSLIIIMASIVYLIISSKYSIRVKFVFVCLFLLTSIKGELFTGLLSFELLVIAFLYGKKSTIHHSK